MTQPVSSAWKCHFGVPAGKLDSLGQSVIWREALAASAEWWSPRPDHSEPRSFGRPEGNRVYYEVADESLPRLCELVHSGLCRRQGEIQAVLAVPRRRRKR